MRRGRATLGLHPLPLLGGHDLGSIQLCPVSVSPSVKWGSCALFSWEAWRTAQVVPAELLRPEPCAAGRQVGSPTAGPRLHLLNSLVQTVGCRRARGFQNRPGWVYTLLCHQDLPQVGFAFTHYIQISEKHAYRKLY